jgi:threonine aldolase
VDLSTVQTNIVVFDVAGAGLSAAEVSARLKAQGVLINPINLRLMRLVTHSDVNRADCVRALEAVKAVASGQ